MLYNKFYIETYGCQMNLNDSEIVTSILSDSGYNQTNNIKEADIILLNTCSVRENAERKIFEKLIHLQQYKKNKKHLIVAVIGCMAERLQDKISNNRKIVNLIVGPDEYRKLPYLIEESSFGKVGIAVELNHLEIYQNIEPLRTKGISAWLSIMRGCDNFCSYCVVPYTRGRERSRDFDSIVEEVIKLDNQGFKEVTLLGQNVNSYNSAKGSFPELLEACANAFPNMRIRFVTSHPLDMNDALIETMAKHDNICKYIHLPVQSGSDRILKLMNRKYTLEHYLGRIKKIKELIPNCSLSTDLIAGFPSETEEDHKQTLDLLRTVKYDGAYMFRYSPREGTAAYNMADDVSEEEKIKRLNEIIQTQQNISKELNQNEIGKVHQILVEGVSKRNPKEWFGRTDTNKVVIFPINKIPNIKIGDYINIKVSGYTSATLIGKIEL